MTLAMLALFSRLHDAGPLSYAVAFLGGTVSFLSPCVLPLVPGYLSVVTGLDLDALEAPDRAHFTRITTSTGLFIFGFALIYVPIGAGAGSLGSLFRRHQDQFTRASGVVILAFALLLAGSAVLKAPWLYREVRLHPNVRGLGIAAPVGLGAAFAFGWSPCLGPVLGSIITMAGDGGRPVAGASLLLAYTLGLGLPFLACGLALGTLRPVLKRVRRHYSIIVLGSAAVMAVFGVLLLTDQLASLSQHLSQFLDDRGLHWLVDLG